METRGVTFKTVAGSQYTVENGHIYGADITDPIRCSFVTALKVGSPAIIALEKGGIKTAPVSRVSYY